MTLDNLMRECDSGKLPAPQVLSLMCGAELGAADAVIAYETPQGLMFIDGRLRAAAGWSVLPLQTGLGGVVGEGVSNGRCS